MPTRIAALLLMFVTPSAFAATDLCAETYNLAASAAYHRDQGLTEDQLRFPLPPRALAAADPLSPKSAKLLLMHQIVDELYAAGDVEAQTYATYKAEQCHRQSGGLPTPASYDLVVPRLIECGKRAETPRITCAMEAAGSNRQDGT